MGFQQVEDGAEFDPVKGWDLTGCWRLCRFVGTLPILGLRVRAFVLNRGVFVLLSLLLRWVRELRDAQIRFLRKENRTLRSRVDQQRLILTPEERSRLLAIGARLEHRAKDLVTVVQLLTYQRWVKEHREGRKPGRVGRTRTIGKPLRDLIVRLVKENPSWGYLRIVGELIKLRCPVGKTSVRRILKGEGLEPRPRPDRSDRPDFQRWEVFVKLHLNTLVAYNFFCENVWTLQGKR